MSPGSSPVSIPAPGPAGDPGRGPVSAKDLPRHAVVEQVMGMPVSVHVRGEEARSPEVDAAIASGLATLHRADAVFSTWKPDSPVSRLRSGELALASCPEVVARVLRQCEFARIRTGGWFDHELPGEDGVRRLDPTGLVKGWAVEQALGVMVEELDRTGLAVDLSVNAAGDVAVHVAAGSGRTWMAGIENPADRTELVAAVPLAAGGIATSGTAARGAHIIDPHSGVPVSRAGSVTVYGPSLMWADVFATAAFAYGPGCEQWLTTLDGWHAQGWGAVVVDAGGGVREAVRG